MESPLDEAELRLALSRALGGRTDFVLQRLETRNAGGTEGFMTRSFGLVATLSVDGASRDVHFFVKLQPASTSHRQFVDEMQHFEKEQGMYESVVPVLSGTLPTGVELPFPRCFLSRLADPPGKVIVMEDLRQKGYRLSDKMVPFDFAHCLLVFRGLARLHAASLLVQRATGRVDYSVDYMDGKFRVATDRLLSDDGEMSQMWADTSAQTMASAVAGLWPERFAAQREMLTGRLREAWKVMSRLAKPSRKYTNVVCHGDLWSNNIMFRYEGKEPTDVVLVDLQLVRFTPPAADLTMLLHTSTVRSFREKHGRDLVMAYHSHLAEIVGEASLRQLLPLETLLASIEEYAVFAKLLSSVMLSITLGSEEEEGAGEPPDFVSVMLRDRGQKVLADARGNAVFRERVCECYEECLRQLGLWT